MLDLFLHVQERKPVQAPRICPSLTVLETVDTRLLTRLCERSMGGPSMHEPRPQSLFFLLERSQLQVRARACMHCSFEFLNE